MPYSARMLLSLYFPGRDCMHYAPSLDQIEEALPSPSTGRVLAPLLLTDASLETSW